MPCLAEPLPGTGFSFVARLQIANLVVICWLSGRWNVDWGQERGQGCLGARGRVPGCCCGPIFVAGAAHSDGSHVTTSANCGNNATKVSWETHTKLHALWLKGRGKQNTSSEAREREGGGGWCCRWHLGWRLEDAVSHFLLLLLLLLPLGPWLHFIFHFSQYPATCTDCGVYRLNIIIGIYSFDILACFWRFYGQHCSGNSASFGSASFCFLCFACHLNFIGYLSVASTTALVFSFSLLSF